MKVLHSILQEGFGLTEDKANVIVVENKCFFQALVREFLTLEEYGESEITFFEKYDEVTKGVNVISDVFNLDVNKTKNLTKLYSNIKRDYITSEKYSKYLELSVQVNEFLNDIIKKYEYSLEYNSNIDVATILKMCNVKFVFEDKSIVEQIIDYIRIMKEFMDIKVFVFINLKSILSYDEIEELYKQIELDKINVLYIETQDYKVFQDKENKIIIDNDLCVIS